MCLTDIVDANGPDISLPDNTTLTATKNGILPLPAVLSTQARTASIVPGLNNSSLLSVPQLCDDGCDVLFRREKMYAVKDKKVVLSGTRNYRDRLWDVPLPYEYPVQKTVMQEENFVKSTPHAGLYNRHVSEITFGVPTVAQQDAITEPKYNSHFQGLDDLIDDNRDYQAITQQLRLDRIQTNVANPQQANIIIRKNKTKKDLAEFLHAACFAPTKSTLIKVQCF